MSRTLITASLLVTLAASACSREETPEMVADAFVDAYFRQMDQEKAKEYTAFGATTMLDKELSDVAQIRKDGYTPTEAAAEVRVQRGESTPREQRIRVPYVITIRTEGGETLRDADVELTKVEGRWKVVRLGLTSR